MKIDWYKVDSGDTNFGINEFPDLHISIANTLDEKEAEKELKRFVRYLAKSEYVDNPQEG